MKKVLSVAAVALALSATAVQAHEGFYAGTSYQAADFKIKAEGAQKIKAHTLNIVAGYDFNQYLAVEGRVGVPVSKQTIEAFEFKPGTSYALFGKGTLPINDMFSVYGLAGYGKSPMNAKITGTDYKGKLDKGSFQYAAGVEVNFTPQIAMTAEYGVYGYGKKTVDSVDYKYDTKGFNLGIKYKF